MKALNLVLILCVIIFLTGCSSDSSNDSDLGDLNTCEGDVVLRSQNDLIDFANSDCQKIIGSLTIIDEPTNDESLGDIFDLSPLNKLIEVTGYVSIINNPNIDNLIGLDNLERIGEALRIVENKNLVEINNFNNLISVNGGLTIEFNENLENISSFNTLIYDSSIETGETNFDIAIQFNPSLIEINGFNQVQEVIGWFSIRDNLILSKIEGFNNLETIGFNFYVVNNPLDTINAFNNLETVENEFTLWNTNIINLANFNSLANIGERFWLDYNHQLINLDGLSNLTTVGGAIRIGYFEGNTSLENIEALANLNAALSLHMQYNASLTSLNGLNNLVNNVYEIDIYDNNVLTDFCAISEIVQAIGAESGNVSIFGNQFNPDVNDFILGNCSQ